VPKPIGMTFLQHNQWDDTLGPWPRKPCKPAGPGEYGPLTSSTWERSCPAKTHTKNGKAPSRDNAINEARNFETIELWIRLWAGNKMSEITQ
jgi:hypothetical protein